MRRELTDIEITAAATRYLGDHGCGPSIEPETRVKVLLVDQYELSEPEALQYVPRVLERATSIVADGTPVALVPSP